jgi:hypothetical protein
MSGLKRWMEKVRRIVGLNPQLSAVSSERSGPGNPDADG